MAGGFDRAGGDGGEHARRRYVGRFAADGAEEAELQVSQDGLGDREAGRDGNSGGIMTVFAPIDAVWAQRVSRRRFHPILFKLTDLRNLIPFLKIGNRNNFTIFYSGTDLRARRIVFHRFYQMNAKLRMILNSLLFFLILYCSLLNLQNLKAEVIENKSDTKIEVLIAGNKFIIPYLFFSPRPIPERTAAVNEWASVGLAFWMPEGSSALDDPLLKPGLGQRYEYQNNIENDKYIVLVRALRSIYNSASPPDPEHQLNNIISGIPGYYVMRKIDENEYLVLATKPKKSDFYFYYGSINDKQKYLIRCIRRDSDKYPACDGDVRYYKYGLTAHIQFPFSEQQKIKEIIKILNSLLLSWEN